MLSRTGISISPPCYLVSVANVRDTIVPTGHTVSWNLHEVGCLLACCWPPGSRSVGPASGPHADGMRTQRSTMAAAAHSQSVESSRLVTAWAKAHAVRVFGYAPVDGAPAETHDVLAGIRRPHAFGIRAFARGEGAWTLAIAIASTRRISHNFMSNYNDGRMRWCSASSPRRAARWRAARHARQRRRFGGLGHGREHRTQSRLRLPVDGRVTKTGYG